MSLFATIPGGPGIPAGCGIVPVVDAQDPLTGIQDANRGATADLCPPTSGCEVVVPVVDTRSWSGCVIPRDLVITLGRRRHRNPNGPPVPDALEGHHVIPRVTALLQWGIGGSANEEAEVDWLHGTQITIAAQNVIVQARYEVITPEGVPDFDPCDLPAFRVSAGVSRGSISLNSNPARLTRVVQILAPGDKTRITIPTFAVSFTALVLGDGLGALIEQVAFGTAYRTQHAFGSPTSNVDQYNVENAVPLWNGAEFLDVTNTNEADALTAFVIFGLAL